MTALGRTLDRLERILRVLRGLDTALSLASPPYGQSLREIDHDLGNRVRDLQSPGGVGVARCVTQAGSWVTHVGVMADGAVLSVRASDPAPAAGAIVAMAGCSGVYTTVKALLGRQRPDVGGHRVRVRDASFPSGHSATAAAAARTLAELHGWPKAPLFVGAACVAASRVYLGVHHPSDAAAGLVIGWAWASGVWAVARRLRTVPVDAEPAVDAVDDLDGHHGGGSEPGPDDVEETDQLRARRRARESGHPVSEDPP